MVVWSIFLFFICHKDQKSDDEEDYEKPDPGNMYICLFFIVPLEIPSLSRNLLQSATD